MFADDKWTRNEAGHHDVRGRRHGAITITAEYPMPAQLDDPIAVLTGRGNQTLRRAAIAPAVASFEDRFERTGD